MTLEIYERCTTKDEDIYKVNIGDILRASLSKIDTWDTLTSSYPETT